MSGDEMYQAEQAIEARELRDRYFGADPEPLPRWQLSVTFGPCDPEEAEELYGDVAARIGSQYGASYGLDRIDGEEV